MEGYGRKDLWWRLNGTHYRYVCARGVTDSLRISERQLSGHFVPPRRVTDTPYWLFLIVDACKTELRYGTAGLNLPLGSYRAN